MILNNMSVIPVEQDYPRIIPFEVIQGKQQKKDQVKYNKDGSIKRTRCNKVSGKDSEVYAFKTKEEIDNMIKVFDRHIEEAKDNSKRQIACRNKLLFVIGINVGIRA